MDAGAWTMRARGDATFLHCISVEIGSGIVNPKYRNVSEADTASTRGHHKIFYLMTRA